MTWNHHFQNVSYINKKAFVTKKTPKFTFTSSPKNYLHLFGTPRWPKIKMLVMERNQQKSSHFEKIVFFPINFSHAALTRVGEWGVCSSQLASECASKGSWHGGGHTTLPMAFILTKVVELLVETFHSQILSVSNDSQICICATLYCLKSFFRSTRWRVLCLLYISHWTNMHASSGWKL